MYYEIYADSLLVLHFFLNFYLLALVNQLLYKVASRKRLVVGALFGTLCSLFPLFLPIHIRVGWMVGFLLSIWVMCKYTFRIAERKQLLQVMEKMVLITLVLGGILRLVLKYGAGWWKGFSGMLVVLLFAPCIYWISCRLLIKKRGQQCDCKVILHNDRGNVEIKALLDTGNTLVEPISGSPVSIAEPETLEKMLGGEWPEGFRMVPFCSVGKQHGLMKAYLVKSLWVEVDGSYKECQNVYVGENKEFFKEGGRYQMILNPGVLEGGK